MSARPPRRPAGRPRDPILELAHLPAAQRHAMVRQLPRGAQGEIIDRWLAWAHDGQCAPVDDWRVWLIRAGRGFGKTRAGAEWVAEVARGLDRDGRIALVGGTMDDARRVMVDGASGLLAIARDDERLVWRAGAGELVFPSGARAFVYSAEAPEALRGPEHHVAWVDELGKWGRGGEAAWDNLMLGLRLGDRPRAVVTTTPRATPLMRRVMTMPGLAETLGRTRDNPHLPPAFVAAVEVLYGRTALGRQELEGELVDEVAGALWTRPLIERCRAGRPPGIARLVVGVDPPAGVGRDACGIVAAARGRDGHLYVLEDASVAGATPQGWARAVAGCAARHGADRVVAEANQGGEMVRAVLRAADATMPVTLVRASRGKTARAEPVAALYEGGHAWHVGAFPALEDELCGLSVGGEYDGPGRSPDRADALVWAATELMLGPTARAGVRGL